MAYGGWFQVGISLFGTRNFRWAQVRIGFDSPRFFPLRKVQRFCCWPCWGRIGWKACLDSLVTLQHCYWCVKIVAECLQQNCAERFLVFCYILSWLLLGYEEFLDSQSSWSSCVAHLNASKLLVSQTVYLKVPTGHFRLHLVLVDSKVQPGLSLSRGKQGKVSQCGF